MARALALVAGVARRYLGVMGKSRKQGGEFRMGFVASHSAAASAEARAPARKLRIANRLGDLDDHGERLTRNMQRICENVAAGRLEDVTDLSDKDLMARVLRR